MGEYGTAGKDNNFSYMREYDSGKFCPPKATVTVFRICRRYRWYDPG